MGATAEPQVQERTSILPPYNLILVNSDDHSFPYVIEMLQKIFGWDEAKCNELTEEVDQQGRAILVTSNKEYVEFKQMQIHNYGPDPRVRHCKGSMSAEIEVA